MSTERDQFAKLPATTQTIHFWEEKRANRESKRRKEAWIEGRIEEECEDLEENEVRQEEK